jgi:hypothetical protein
MLGASLLLGGVSLSRKSFPQSAAQNVDKLGRRSDEEFSLGDGETSSVCEVTAATSA